MSSQLLELAILSLLCATEPRAASPLCVRRIHSKQLIAIADFPLMGIKAGPDNDGKQHSSSSSQVVPRNANLTFNHDHRHVLHYRYHHHHRLLSRTSTTRGLLRCVLQLVHRLAPVADFTQAEARDNSDSIDARVFICTDANWHSQCDNLSVHNSWSTTTGAQLPSDFVSDISSIEPNELWVCVFYA